VSNSCFISSEEDFSRWCRPSDKDGEVRRCAVHALSKLGSVRHGADFVVEAGTLKYVPRLLRSSDVNTRKWACEMLANLVFHKYELSEKLCTRIVDLLRCVGCLTLAHQTLILTTVKRRKSACSPWCITDTIDDQLYIRGRRGSWGLQDFATRPQSPGL
jgi:hypothetical protein